MISWLSQFAVNLADFLIFPVVGGTIVAAIIAFWSLKDRAKNKYAFGSIEFTESRWRTMVAAQGTLIMWIVWGLLNAVPEPNYQIKEVQVVRTVTIKKNVIGTYNQAYDICADNFRSQGIMSNKVDAVCNRRAMLLTYPGLKMVKQTVTVPAKPKVIIKYRTDPYRTLYNTCMGQDLEEHGWTMPSQEEIIASGNAKTAADYRNERIQLCHDNAIRARQNLIESLR